MKSFRTLTAPACPLPFANVDTDQIIPARFMRQPRQDGGYGKFLLHDMRRDDKGALLQDFPLNKPQFSASQIMIARDNFGCGSSREPAVYALADFGIQCVIAPSFGDIFSSNCIRNGVLPARISAQDAESLLALQSILAGQNITVDLEAMTITAGNLQLTFDVPEQWRVRLLNGWDDIDLTLSHADAIKAFTEHYQAANPWTQPRRA
ncbi:MAG: 3-isopropylmalate dehydratase small subunit [Alphaproteobacteria bacterium]|nr:3-isopropylmalate dehydratase small subunit [Alphaproteobacteria bacterium]